MSRKWEKVYRKYLDNSDLSYIEMGKKMDQYRPKKLYRYMRFDDFWEKNVFEGQVYLSEASNLNDPFDCLVYIDHKLYTDFMFQKARKVFPETNGKVLRETVKESVNEIVNNYLYDMKKDIRVACFTENNTYPLMWAHYADSHKGFCIEYDLTKIPEGYRLGILPVIYSDERYDVTNAVVTRDINLLMNPYYFKSSHWKYEKEWRMVITEDMVADGEFYADFHEGISGIHLGLKCFDCHKEKADKIIEEYSQKEIPVYKVIIEPSNYNLRSVQIN